MGAWGSGLYSDDVALDLRTAIAALAKLPFDGDRILAILREEDYGADNCDDEYRTVFWLVTADQFARRGIRCTEATRRALEIIATGQDIENVRDLGLDPAGVRAREKMLAQLATKLRNPPAVAPRKTLAKPQQLLLETESVWRYPTMRGNPRNPYFATAEEERFVADGWGALLVVDSGLAFGWLAWYAVVPLRLRRLAVQPTLTDVPKARFYTTRVLSPTPDDDTAQVVCICGGPGTLSRTGMKRLGLELLGKVAIARNQVPAYLTEYATSTAASDRDISNELDVERCRPSGPRVADWLIH